MNKKINIFFNFSLFHFKLSSDFRCLFKINENKTKLVRYLKHRQNALGQNITMGEGNFEEDNLIYLESAVTKENLTPEEINRRIIAANHDLRSRCVSTKLIIDR